LNKCILIICVGVGVATLGIEQAVGNEWPGFGGPTADFRSSRSDNLAELPIVPRLQWRKTLGPGLSGLVVSGDFVYACYLDPQADQREVVVALHRKTGRTIWEQSYHAPLDTQQEVFGGRSRSPQATPLVIGDRLVTIGFSGIMHAFDLRTGRIAWKRSLVKEYSAVPVQFGFSSSPIEVDGRLVVCAGGKGGGLICLDVKDGSMIWNVACDEASYATPVILEVEGTRQIVFVTRNEIVGVEANTGARFWQYNLPQRELTNVPTPLITSDGGLIVSGQGVGGTAKLNIRLSGREWKVDEAWMNTFQFFYCNWVLHNERVIGCQGDLLIALASGMPMSACFETGCF
jgi:outer membrane protein assembly factor BamB